MKLQKGNVFSYVSVCSGGGGLVPVQGPNPHPCTGAQHPTCASSPALSPWICSNVFTYEAHCCKQGVCILLKCLLVFFLFLFIYYT